MSISARKAKGTRIRDSRGDRVFTVVNYIILTLFGLAALYPLIYVLSASISEPLAVNSGRMKLWPVGFNIEGYKSILSNKWILTGYGNSLFYTVVGTFLNVLVTFMASYSLSRKDMYGHGLITFFMVFTMWFGGGLIPTFLVVKKLGLVNTRMVLLLLGLVSVYNCIICRSFISSSIPYELQEAARIDGCNDFQIVWRIIFPLSGPVLAIHGKEDITVDPEWSNKIVAASKNEASKTYFIEGMDHTFNVFSEEDFHSLYNAVDATGEFFKATLAD